MTKQKLIALKSVLFSVALASSSMTSYGTEMEKQGVVSNQSTEQTEGEKKELEALEEFTSLIFSSKYNLKGDQNKIEELYSLIDDRYLSYVSYEKSDVDGLMLIQPATGVVNSGYLTFKSLKVDNNNYSRLNFYPDKSGCFEEYCTHLYHNVRRHWEEYLKQALKEYQLSWYYNEDHKLVYQYSCHGGSSMDENKEYHRILTMNISYIPYDGTLVIQEWSRVHDWGCQYDYLLNNTYQIPKNKNTKMIEQLAILCNKKVNANDIENNLDAIVSANYGTINNKSTSTPAANSNTTNKSKPTKKIYTVDNLQIFNSYANNIQKAENLTKVKPETVNDYVKYLQLEKEDDFKKITQVLVQSVLSNEEYTLSKDTYERAIEAKDNSGHTISISNGLEEEIHLHTHILDSEYTSYYSNFHYMGGKSNSYFLHITESSAEGLLKNDLNLGYFPDTSVLYITCYNYDGFVDGKSIEILIPDKMKTTMVEQLLAGYNNSMSGEDMLTNVTYISQEKQPLSLSLSK